MFLKRGIFLILLIFLAFGVFAQDNSGSGSQNSGINFGDGATSTGVDDDISDEDEVDVLIEQIEQDETFGGDFSEDAGLTPDDGFLYDLFDGIFESREENIAEMRETAEGCHSGDESACIALEESFDEYKEYADIEEKEVSPEKKEDFERQTRAIQGVVVREIAKNAPPTLKDELVRQVVQREGELLTSSDIVAEIARLCDKLINGLGDFGAAEKAGCTTGNANFEYLNKKRGEWKGKIGDDARAFLDVLQQCMEVSDDNILGNTDGCGCEDMPTPKNAELCSDIVVIEDCKGAGGDDCGNSDALIEEFMSALPEDLRTAMEDRFGGVEDEKYGPRGGGELEREFRRRAPGPCLNAADRGEIDFSKGMLAVRRECERIMMEDFAPECAEQDLSPDECAELMSEEGLGRGRGPPRGPGVDFVNCEDEGFESDSEKLECYRHNRGNADFTQDYYTERSEFRQRGDFDEFEFEKKFRNERRDDYAKQYTEESRFRGRGGGDDFDARFRETQERQNQCIQQCEGENKAWDFRGGQCRCFGGDDFRRRGPEGFFPSEHELRQGPPEGWRGAEGNWPQGSPPEWQSPEGQQWQGSPPGGWPEGQIPPSSPEGQTLLPEQSVLSPEPTPEPTPESLPPPESGATGGVVWGSITGNAFLDYHWWG